MIFFLIGRQFAWNVKTYFLEKKKEKKKEKNNNISICPLLKILLSILSVNTIRKLKTTLASFGHQGFINDPKYCTDNKIEMVVKCITNGIKMCKVFNIQPFEILLYELRDLKLQYKTLTNRFYITKTRLFKYIENFTTKNWKFSVKNSDIFHISAQNIDCGTR